MARGVKRFVVVQENSVGKKWDSSASDRRFRGTLSKVEKLSQLADLRRQKRQMRGGYGWQRRGKEGGVWGCAAQGE